MWVIPLAPVFNDHMPQNKGKHMSTDRKSVTVLVGFSFPHAIYCEHLTVPSFANYFCEKFMVFFEGSFVYAN